jgi:chromosome partitioning protein
VGKVIAVINQKGGVAKTTSVINLADGLTNLGKKVLVIDMDPQANATSGLGIDRRKLKYSIYDVLINNMTAETLVLATKFGSLAVLPATISLAGAEIELVPAIARESKLKKAIQHLRQCYDYTIIDCPPSLGLLTVNALTAADSIMIPVQCEYYALEGLEQLLNTYDLVRKHLNTSLQLEGVILTMFDSRTNLSVQVVDEVKEFFGPKVYTSIIPRNVRLSEAPSHGKPISYYDPKSKGAEMYAALAEEVLARNSGK